MGCLAAMWAKFYFILWWIEEHCRSVWKSHIICEENVS